MKLYDFDAIRKGILTLRKTHPGAVFYQQFSCQHCNTKQTMEKPDTLFTRGICEECGKETNIQKNGCNYMVVLRTQNAEGKL